VIHALLIHLPEFRVLGLHVLEERVHGRIKISGDAASHGLFGVIRGVTPQLETAIRRLEIPKRTLDFLSEVCSQIVELESATREGPMVELVIVPALVNENPVTRPQSQDERGCMLHLGLGYLNSESPGSDSNSLPSANALHRLKWDLQQAHRKASPQGVARRHRRSGLV